MNKNKRRKSKRKRGIFYYFIPNNNKRKNNKKTHSENDKVKHFLLKITRNILIFIGLIILCYAFFFEFRIYHTSANGKENSKLVLIEKWQFNPIIKFKIANNTTVVLKDYSTATILASGDDNVLIKDNKLYLNGDFRETLPTSFGTNTTYFLDDNQYLALSDKSKLLVIDSSKLSGEITAYYKLSQY